MMKRILYFLLLISAFVACEDDDSFSSASGLRLTFETDTLKMDTVFSRSASSTYSFWVYNNNSDGLRLSNVRLSRGNQTGFRVNVDGSYLDNSNGSIVNDLEIRRKDSILVFVELTPADTRQLEPRSLDDDLVYSLTAAVFDHTEEISKENAKGEELSVENATSGITIPFHEGAARYYEEHGVSVNWQEED